MTYDKLDTKCLECLARTEGHCCPGVEQGEKCLSSNGPVYRPVPGVEKCNNCENTEYCGSTEGCGAAEDIANEILATPGLVVLSEDQSWPETPYLPAGSQTSCYELAQQDAKAAGFRRIA